MISHAIPKFALLLLIGCTSTPRVSPDPDGYYTGGPTDSSAATAPFSLDGDYVFEWTATNARPTGNCLLAMYLYGPAKSSQLGMVSAASGATNGGAARVTGEPAVSYYIDVVSSCNWAISFHRA